MHDRPKLIAAVHTPLNQQGELNIGAIEKQAEFLINAGAAGVFPGGTTGESLSLTTDERLALAKQWVDVCAGTKLKVIVHVGHNCLPDALALSRQAGEIGADGVAAMPPCYFKPNSVGEVVSFMGQLASAAPELPFYYYDIPPMTDVRISMCDFVTEARTAIPNLVGIKYSNTDLHQLQELLHHPAGVPEVLFGCDEVLLTAWVLGVRGAVGSTYNFLLLMFHQMLADFARGDVRAAKEHQYRALRFVRTLQPYGFLGASKLLMNLLGVDCGPVRAPLNNLTAEQQQELFAQLKPFAEFFSAPLREPGEVAAIR